MDDMAEASLFVHNLNKKVLFENIPIMPHYINIVNDNNVMIKELAKTVKNVLGISSELFFVRTTPDVTPSKLMDV